MRALITRCFMTIVPLLLLMVVSSAVVLAVPTDQDAEARDSDLYTGVVEDVDAPITSPWETDRTSMYPGEVTSIGAYRALRGAAS